MNKTIETETAANSKELFEKAAEKEKQGFTILKIFVLQTKGIFKFLFRKNKKR